MRLDDAVNILQDSALSISGTTWTPDKLHRAITAAGNRFIRETMCSKARVSISLTSGNSEYNLASSITGFTPDWFVWAYIGFKPVVQTTWQSLQRFYDVGSIPTGVPTLLAFDADATVLVYPRPITTHTLSLTYRKPLTTFTAGTASNPEINIPDEYVYDVIWWGARSYLIAGAPGHPEQQAALQKFEQLIQYARERFSSNLPGSIDDRNTHPKAAAPAAKAT